MKRNVLCGLVVLSLVAMPLAGANAQQKKTSGDDLVVKVYRVADIVAPAPNYPYEGTYLPQLNSSESKGLRGSGQMGGGGMGGGGGGMFRVPDHLAQVSGGGGGGAAVHRNTRSPIGMDSLIDAIQNIVEPDTWDEVGGKGSISAIGGALAVRQTPAVQEGVQEFLEALKKESGRLNTLTVVARWLALDSEQLAQLLGGSNKAASGQAIDPAALAEVSPKAERFRGQITCFNGQTVHIVSGRIESMIESAIPVIGTAVGYQPVVLTPHLGILLELTPSALPGDDGVLIDLSSTVTHWQKPGPAISWFTSGEDVQALKLDRLNVTAQQFATSLRLPLDKPVLAGGMTFPADASAGASAPSDKPAEAVYLVVEVSENAL